MQKAVSSCLPIHAHRTGREEGVEADKVLLHLRGQDTHQQQDILQLGSSSSSISCRGTGLKEGKGHLHGSIGYLDGFGAATLFDGALHHSTQVGEEVNEAVPVVSVDYGSAQVSQGSFKAKQEEVLN